MFSKVIIPDDEKEIELSLERPRFIKVIGRTLKKTKEWHLIVTENHKLVLL